MKQIILTLILTLFIVITCFAQDFTLTWNANTESDLVGYKLYYRTIGVSYNDPTPIEDEVPLHGPSPIVLYINCDPLDFDCVDNSDPSFTFTMDLSDKDYWMVLTAFDNEVPEKESGFSNEVTTEEIQVGIPSSSEDNNSSGGSGCFINILIGR